MLLQFSNNARFITTYHLSRDLGGRSHVWVIDLLPYVVDLMLEVADLNLKVLDLRSGETRLTLTTGAGRDFREPTSNVSGQPPIIVSCRPVLDRQILQNLD